jgi:PAS domain S-box-containing protein/diguanylate cyclase (GGDEF)-like protein
MGAVEGSGPEPPVEPGPPRASELKQVLADAEAAGVSADDLAALRALAAVARDRAGFRKAVMVDAVTDGLHAAIEFEVVHTDAGPAVHRLGSGSTARPDEDELDIERVLSDTLVGTPDLVAVFASVGHEAMWANDAFATLVPIRAEDKVWLVELLDEWSKGHYEVKVLPALVKYGRWRGRLSLVAGEDSTPVSAVIVAHRDPDGEIEAVSVVARQLAGVQSGLEPDEGHMSFEALVEHTADLLIVASPDGVVSYASPATVRALGTEDGRLVGAELLSMVHPEDRPQRLAELARPDEQGVGLPVELRLHDATGSWRHFEIVVTDLSDNPAIGGVVLNARDVTDRVRNARALADRAYTDASTGLPNRMRLLDRLESLLHLAAEEPVLFLLLDVDDFDQVELQFGATGIEQAVVAVAERLSRAAPAAALLARLDHHRFAVVMPGVSSVDDGVRVANRLRLAIGGKMLLPGGAVELTATAAVVVAHEPIDPDDILREAEHTVEAGQVAGGDRVELSTSAPPQVAYRRKTVEQVRRALANDGVAVHYQPIHEVATGEPRAAEALLRVHDGDGDLLSPAEFIEAAESAGLMARLGAQVLDATCEHLAGWTDRPGCPVEVSVNISSRQLADRDLPTVVAQALEAHGVAPERLWLEITESALVSHVAMADTTIVALRALGVRVGLDEFGAGHSSLGNLKRFPLDFVKIDRSLVAGLGSDEQDTAIVRATVELAQNLELDVVAVGVETDAQLDILRLLECDLAQGYLFSPPVEATELGA